MRILELELLAIEDSSKIFEKIYNLRDLQSLNDFLLVASQEVLPSDLNNYELQYFTNNVKVNINTNPALWSKAETKMYPAL